MALIERSLQAWKHTYWEALCIPPLLLTHRFCYDLVGAALSGKENGMNYAYLLATPLDLRIPYIPLFILPYLLTWLYGLFIFIYAAVCGTYNHQTFRYFYLSFVFLTLLECIVWYNFPASINLRAPAEVLSSSGWLGSLTGYVYERATPWNVIPSAHIAFAFIAWLFSKHFAPAQQRWLFLLVFIITGFSVVFIKNHYLADIIGGMAAGYLVYQLIFLPAFRRGLLARLPTYAMLIMSYSIFFIAAICYIRVIGTPWN